MSKLTEEEKEYLDEKFESFKLSFWQKFKLPALGLAVVFAGLVSIFATYLYMQAKINVMENHEELTAAKVTFYNGMIKANQEIENMVDRYNKLAAEAEISVSRMKQYEEELERIAKRHQELRSMRPEGHPGTIVTGDGTSTPATPLELPDETIDEPAEAPKIEQRVPTFKIDPRMQQQMPPTNRN
jgi:hypothetical protein